MGTRPTPGPPTPIDIKVIGVLRQKTPAEKLLMTFDRMESMRTLRRATEQLRPSRAITVAIVPDPERGPGK